MPRRRNNNGPFWLSTDTFHKRMIESALRDAEGEMRTAAARLGISRTHLYALCKRLVVDPKEYHRKEVSG